MLLHHCTTHHAMACSQAAGVMFDESTTNTLDKQLIVYLVLLNADSSLSVEYVDCPTLSGGDAESVHTALEQCLADVGLPIEKVTRLYPYA